MQWAPDTSDKWAPDPGAPNEWALDSATGPLTLGTAVEHFVTAKAAEGASPKTIEWYRMVLGRAARDLGARRPLDALTSTELRIWLLGLRATLSPISVAGYVRGLKAFGNWCAAEQLAEARAVRTLRRPQVPHKLVEPLSDDALRRLLDAASLRDRAIVLLFLDTGLRLSELAGLRRCDLRADGSIKVMGKGSRERVVPVGAAARQALLRYLRQTESADSREPIFRARWRGVGLAWHPAGVQSTEGANRHSRSLQSPHAPPHLRPVLPRQRRDAFSLQRILGHTTLDMVKRYVALADGDLAARHLVASPGDRLLGVRRVGERGASA